MPEAAAAYDMQIQKRMEYLTKRFQRERGGDLQELQSAANWYAVIACRGHDPTKGASLSTWCVKKARGGILNHHLSERAKQQRLPSEPLLDRDVEQRRSEWLDQFQDRLSGDARTVLSLILKTPPPYHTYHHVEAQKIKQQVKSTLRNKGWIIKRITDSFQEIKQALGH